MKRILIVVNPCAGKDSKRININDVIRAFNDKEIECFEKTTTCHGDAVNIVKEYASDFDAVVCCGGDGTYNEVINGLMTFENRPPVIYLPCGSTNDFANSLRISNNPEVAAQMFSDGVTNKFDIGLFNDKYFTYVAAFGIGTSFSYNTSQKFKNKLGHSAYVIDGMLLNIVSVVKNLKAYHMRIEYDEGVIEDDFYFGAVGNTNKIAGLFKLDNFDIKMNDGLFEVLLVKKSNPLGLLKVFLNALRQDYSDKSFEFIRTSKLKITSSEPVDWTIDGEYAGSQTNLEILNCNKAITLVSPDNKFLV